MLTAKTPLTLHHKGFRSTFLIPVFCILHRLFLKEKAFAVSPPFGKNTWTKKEGSGTAGTPPATLSPVLSHSKEVSFLSSTEQFSSVDPMDCSTPGFPVHHQLPELAQIHIHWVGDAIQPSHPLSSPSPSAFNLSQHQGLFQWVSFSHQVAKVLELQIQHHSFQRVFKVDFFRFNWFNFLALPGTLESFPASQLKSINSSALCLLYFPALSYTFIVWV